MAIKKPPPDDPKQSARFVETAKSTDADISGKAFARVLKRVIPKKIASKTRRKPR